MSSNASISSVSKDATPAACLGGSWAESGRIYRIEVTKILEPGYPSVRHSTTAYLVPYEQLSQRIQQINRLGGKITSVTSA